MKTFNLTKLTELILLFFLVLFPFSFPNSNIKYLIINAIVSGTLFFIVFVDRNNLISNDIWKIFVAIIFLYLFDFTEKINFIQQFGLPFDINKRIPLSTILLCVLFLTSLINYLVTKEITMPDLPFIKYILITSVFLIFLALLFYPLFYIFYHFRIENNFLLFNKILKYVIIILVMTSYLNTETKVKKISISLLVSFGLNALLSLIILVIHIK